MEFAKYISEKILFKSREDVVRVHLYTRLLEIGHTPYESDLNILVALYEMGGYDNGVEQANFFKLCVEKKYKKNIQSVRNTLSLYTDLGVLEKPKNEKRFVSKNWLSPIESEKLVLDYKISHN